MPFSDERSADEHMTDSSPLINHVKARDAPTGVMTPYLMWICAVSVIGPFNYGYAAGVLNSPEEVIRSCQNDPADYLLPPCFSISSGTWGFIVGLFSIGGLVGGMTGGSLANRLGRRGSMLITNIFFILGSLLMSVAPSVWVLGLGRTLIGIGAGIATVVVPLYLGEISPSNLRGAIGVLTQLALTTGILVSQVLGLFMSDVPEWRWLVGIVGFLDIVQTVILPICPESPRFLFLRGKQDDAEKVLRRLRGRPDVSDELQLMEASSTSSSETSQSAIQLVKDRSLRLPLVIAIVLQCTQQLSGINAVFYYSTSILESSFPESADVITVTIGALNVVLTIVSVFLMDRAGRRALLLIGQVGMITFSCLMVLSLELNIVGLQLACIYLFVSSFAIGLGPIPFLIISEIFPTTSVGAAASIAMPFNWACNFAIAQLFPFMNEGLGSYSFLPFAVILMGALAFTIRYIPETKGRQLSEIVNSLRS